MNAFREHPYLSFPVSKTRHNQFQSSVSKDTLEQYEPSFTLKVAMSQSTDDLPMIQEGNNINQMYLF